MLAKQSETHAHRLLSGSTVFAGTITDAGIDHHWLACGNRADVRAGRVEVTGTIGAEDPRRPDGDPRQTSNGEHIEMIECGSMKPHSHLACTWFGHW